MAGLLKPTPASPFRVGSDLPDRCEDCNRNGVPHDLDLSLGTSPAWNAKGNAHVRRVAADRW